MNIPDDYMTVYIKDTAYDLTGVKLQSYEVEHIIDEIIDRYHVQIKRIVIEAVDNFRRDEGSAADYYHDSLIEEIQ